MRPLTTKCLGFKIRGHLNGIKYPCLCETKYDGEPCVIQFISGAPLRIYTSTSEVELPHLEPVRHKFMGRAEFLGEWIYDNKKSGDEGLNGDLYSLTANKDNLALTTLKIHDTLMANTLNMYAFSPLTTRKKHLIDAIHPAFLPKAIIAQNKEQVLAFFEEMTVIGYEGIVVKNLNETLGAQSWVKIKAEDCVQLPVVKVEAGRIEVLHGETRVGVKRTFPVQINDIVEVKHNGVLDSGSLRNPRLVR